MRAQAVRRAKSGMLDDDDLQQLILDRFDEDPAFWTGTGKTRVGITVEVDDGQVRLSGVVRNALDRRRADLLARSEEHTSELQSPCNLVCRLLLEKKKRMQHIYALKIMH